jgi:thioredoxin reductase (NADPH)
MNAAARPVILAVDADADALGRVERELVKRYGEDYRVVCAASAEGGLRALAASSTSGEAVALVLADQWLPGTTGAAFLAEARRRFPAVKRLLLLAWGEWGDPATGGALRRAMALGQADYYAVKPWCPPNEHFHRTVGGLLYDWMHDQPRGAEEICIVGDPLSPRSHELRDLAGRHGSSHAFYAADSPEGRARLERAGLPGRLPMMLLPGGRALADPTNAQIAEAFGASPRLEQTDYDLVVVGGGPAGLSAAVYGASEGLRTLLVERQGFGGQASSSSLIRNYLGFSRGLSGAELARQAHEQAWLLGATYHLMHAATGLRRRGRDLVLTTSDGSEVTSRAVVLATGVSYRRLDAPGLDALHGVGVFYGAAAAEARGMAGREAYVVGGANSAGQAALHLAKYAARVTLVVRGNALAAGMSDYLVRQIAATENIAVRLGTEVAEGGGAGQLEYLVLRERASGHSERVPAGGLFILIGARPHTGWLPEEVARDDAGYILTGRDVPTGGRAQRHWPLERAPLLLETSMPGVFAAGDVRHGAVQRVASAVGEGSIAIRLVHEYLEATANLNEAERMPGDLAPASA